MAKKNDLTALKLINEIKRQKSEIAKAERPNWRTNCSFSYTESASDVLNLNVIGIKPLLLIAAFLKEKEQSYNAVAAELNVEAPKFTWCNFTTDEWLSDIKLRIDKIQIITKKKKLDELESRLNAIISPEMKAEMELQAISEELN